MLVADSEADKRCLRVIVEAAVPREFLLGIMCLPLGSKTRMMGLQVVSVVVVAAAAAAAVTIIIIIIIGVGTGTGN